MTDDPLYLQPEGDLPQEEIPSEGSPPDTPEVIVTERPLQPSYWTGLVPFAPATVKLELDREANHIQIRNVKYIPPPYPNLFSAQLAFFWGQPSALGGILRSGEWILIDGVYLKNTVLFLQALTPAAGAGANILIAEIYYW